MRGTGRGRDGFSLPNLSCRRREAKGGMERGGERRCCVVVLIKALHGSGDDSSVQADSQFKLVGFVCESTAACCYPTAASEVTP